MMKKVEEREKKKMDEMKKKLHTDDESRFIHEGHLGHILSLCCLFHASAPDREARKD